MLRSKKTRSNHVSKKTTSLPTVKWARCVKRTVFLLEPSTLLGKPAGSYHGQPREKVWHPFIHAVRELEICLHVVNISALRILHANKWHLIPKSWQSGRSFRCFCFNSLMRHVRSLDGVELPKKKKKKKERNAINYTRGSWANFFWERRHFKCY